MASPTAAGQVADTKPRKRRLGRYRLAPILLVSINAVMFCVFFVWPAVMGLIYSFTDYRGVGSFHWVGLANYLQLFSDDSFYSALLRTLIYAVLTVPLTYVLSLGIAALLVSKHTKGKAVARIIFFVPWLISPIVNGVIWRWMFGQSFGFINYVIKRLGGPEVPWQSNANLSLLVVVFAASWAGTAFSMMLFIAALKNVPISYHEAAALDGANGWQRFTKITMPCIRPTSFMVILLGSIGAMKEFAMVQSLNGGGPGTANNLMVQYIYQNGFDYAKIGYASAASMVLMVILLVLALIQLRINQRRDK